MPWLLQMRAVHVSLMLVLLSGKVLVGSPQCEWGVRLCDIGDPLEPTSTCNLDSPLTSLSGSIEVQEFSTKVQAIMETLTDQPVDTQSDIVSPVPVF